MYSGNLPQEIIQAVKDNPRKPKEQDGDYAVRVLASVIKQIEQDIEKTQQANLIDQSRYAHSFVLNHQEYQIPVNLFSQWCKENKLSEQEMIKVSNGEIREHKGYTRSNRLDNPFLVGKPYTPPKEVPPEYQEPHRSRILEEAKHRNQEPVYVSPPEPKPVIRYGAGM